MRILIACTKPLGFFMGWHWSWLGWEAVHNFSEVLVKDLDCFEDFNNLVIGVLLDIGLKGGESFL